MSTPEKNEYEMLRERNIARNAEKMRGLGLEDVSLKQPKPRSTSKPRKKRSAVPVEGERRSKRNRGEKPEYTKEKIDNFGEELDRIAGGCSERRAYGLANKPQSEQAEELSEEHKEMILEVKNELLAKRASYGTKVESDDEAAWKTEALGRWGDMVELASPESWQVYVKSRLCMPPPPCPGGVSLLQERYTEDAWHLLIACNLMSRVSSGPVKERCIEGFFSRWPTPTAALNADPTEVQPVIDSLGLFDSRYRSVVEVSRSFLSFDEFDCSRQGPTKLYGIGDFGVSSFEIWCRGLGPTLHPNDRNLAAYCDALRREAKKEVASGEASAWQTPAAGSSKPPAVTVKPEPMEDGREDHGEDGGGVEGDPELQKALALVAGPPLLPPVRVTSTEGVGKGKAKGKGTVRANLEEEGEGGEVAKRKGNRRKGASHVATRLQVKEEEKKEETGLKKADKGKQNGQCSAAGGKKAGSKKAPLKGRGRPSGLITSFFGR